MNENWVSERREFAWGKLSGAIRGKRVAGELHERFSGLRSRLSGIKTIQDVEQFEKDVNDFIDDFNEDRKDRGL